MSTFIQLVPGSAVTFAGRKYVITHLLDFETLLARDTETNLQKRLPISGVSIGGSNSIAESKPDIALVGDEDWQFAMKCFDIIRPLLEKKNRTTALVEERAALAGVHRATIYRWIESYETLGTLTALLPRKRSGGRGKSRLTDAVEDIIKSTIENFYLKKQKRSVQKTCDEVKLACRNSGLPAPHPNTVRNRIVTISEKVKLESRIGAQAAQAKFEPIKGSFPEADWPLQTVQIDHTKVDIVLVDDAHRLPIGRPWITIAIDVFSRMVVGFYISFDPPGAMSTGLCLANAILPKEKWLAKLGIENPWPVWGLMRTIHADNAKEFRGNMLARACQEYGIDLKWRPVKRPNYGGHIERLCGTLNHEIHSLPGTTFSNIQERGDYDSEGNATMTFSEFETWLTTFITGVYHQRVHSQINTSPLKKYEEGIFGDERSPGVGLPKRIADEERLRLDLMPYLERTVQNYGIAIDEVHYYHDVLRPWINATDSENPRQKRQFLVRRDPRDISVIYFFDPEVKLYYEIPYRDVSRPPMSIWEFREARKRVKTDGLKEINEDIIFESYNRMRELEEEAQKKTKKARRDGQRRKMHQESSTELRAKVVNPSCNAFEEQAHIQVTPFDDMEEL